MWPERGTQRGRPPSHGRPREPGSSPAGARLVRTGARARWITTSGGECLRDAPPDWGQQSGSPPERRRVAPTAACPTEQQAGSPPRASAQRNIRHGGGVFRGRPLGYLQRRGSPPERRRVAPTITDHADQQAGSPPGRRRVAPPVASQVAFGSHHGRRCRSRGHWDIGPLERGIGRGMRSSVGSTRRCGPGLLGKTRQVQAAERLAVLEPASGTRGHEDHRTRAAIHETVPMARVTHCPTVRRELVAIGDILTDGMTRRRD